MTESHKEPTPDSPDDVQQNPGGGGEGQETGAGPEAAGRGEGAFSGVDSAAGEEVLPDIGGYGDRDPKTEMPRIPSVPETQEDPKPHDAAPDPRRPERTGSE